MSNEKIKEFYVKLATNAEFKKDVENLKLHRSEDLSEECIRKIVSEIILPWGKKLGYNFSEEEVLEFEKSQANSTKEKLNAEDLENVSGGINLMALLMAALSFVSPINALRTSNTDLAKVQGISTISNPTLPIELTPEAMPIESLKVDQSLYSGSEQDFPEDKSFETVESSGVGNILFRDEFLKAIDGSEKIDETATIIQDTMDAHGTWLLSAKQLKVLASVATSVGASVLLWKEMSKQERKQESMDVLSMLPTDEEGLKPYLAIEVDKFKDYFDEFLEKYHASDLATAAQNFIEHKPDFWRTKVRKEARNLSKETLLKIKKTLLLNLNKACPQVLDASNYDIEEVLNKKEVDEKEKYLDSGLNKFKSLVSDYDRAKVVYNWVAENIAYNNLDVSTSLEPGEGKFRDQAEQVFKNRMTSCRGYAHMTELMMRVVGLPCIYLVGDRHAYNAIFVNGEWFLIDTTWAAYREANKHLEGCSPKDVPANYKENPKYNVVTPRWRGRIRPEYFPSNQDDSKQHNEEFMYSHTQEGAVFRFEGENGVGEIMMDESAAGIMIIWDVTKECIVDGELKLPSEILEKVEHLYIDNKKVLDKIKKIHIPKNIKYLGYRLERALKNMDEVTVDPDNPYYGASEGFVWTKGHPLEILKVPSEEQVHIPKDFPAYLSLKLQEALANVKKVTVDPDNPHYIMYTPKLLGKPGLFHRSTYLLPFAKPLWIKPD